MKPRLFDIVLTKTDGVYFSGQTVQGHVMIELDASIKVKGIRMVCKGKAFVHWTDQNMRGPGEPRYQSVRHHSATEEYIDVSQSLMSKGPEFIHNGHKKILEAGQFTYPFQIHIPSTCPSSFEGQYGFVRYWLKVTIERPWKESISVKKLFTVICQVDLNRDPSASQPIQNQKDKRLCCFCCTSGPLVASLRLNHKGYVPGESLSIFAETHNNTRRKIGSTSIELLMTSTFQTPTKTRSVTQTVTKLQHGGIPAGGSDLWNGDKFILPSLPPSFMVGCGIMTIRYTLELRVYPVGPAFELTVPIEILVGTVPLHSTLESHLMSLQMTPPTPRTRGACADSDTRPLPYSPPTFSSSSMCDFHVRDDEDDHVTTIIDSNFSPKFINFNFQTVPHHKKQQTVRFAT